MRPVGASSRCSASASGAAGVISSSASIGSVMARIGPRASASRCDSHERTKIHAGDVEASLDGRPAPAVAAPSLLLLPAPPRPASLPAANDVSRVRSRPERRPRGAARPGDASLGTSTSGRSRSSAPGGISMSAAPSWPLPAGISTPILCSRESSAGSALPWPTVNVPSSTDDPGAREPPRPLPFAVAALDEDAAGASGRGSHPSGLATTCTTSSVEIWYEPSVASSRRMWPRKTRRCRDGITLVSGCASTLSSPTESEAFTITDTVDSLSSVFRWMVKSSSVAVDEGSAADTL